MRTLQEIHDLRSLLYLAIDFKDLHISYFARKIHLFLFKNDAGLD